MPLSSMMGLGGIDDSIDIPRANVGILPAPPAAAAMQWAKLAREAFDQVRSATGAVKIAAGEAAKWAGVAKQAAMMSANQQAMKEQAAAAAVAKSLGYYPEAVGVPTANVYGEIPVSSPPYAFNHPNPPPPMELSIGFYGALVSAFASYLLPFFGSPLFREMTVPGDDPAISAWTDGCVERDVMGAPSTWRLDAGCDQLVDPSEEDFVEETEDAEEEDGPKSPSRKFWKTAANYHVFL